MVTWAVLVAALVLGEDGDLLRFGGQAAVPGADASDEAPVEVAPRPRGPDAIYRTRGGGWRFFDGARDRVVELPVTGDRIVGWSANGGSVLTASAGPDGGRIVRWRAGTWREVAELVPTTRPEDAAISPDGHHVLVAGPTPDGPGRRFTLFGGTVGLALMKVDRPDAIAGAPVALSDARAAIVRDGVIEILRLPRLEPEREIRHRGAVGALALGDEGKTLVVVSTSQVVIDRYALATGERAPTSTWTCTRGTVSANGRVVACLAPGEAEVLLVDLASDTLRASVPVPKGRLPVLDAAGTRVALPGNRAVPIWDATVDGVLPAAARAGVVKQLDVMGDGSVLALEVSGVARVWDPQHGTESFRVASPAAAIAATADGVGVVSAGTPLVVLDPTSGEPRWTVKRSRPIAVDVAPDGRVFWIERTGALHVRQADGRARRLALAPRGARPSAGALPRPPVSPARRRVLFGPRVLDATNGKVLDEIAAGPAAWLGERLVVAGADGVATADEGTALTFAGAQAITALAGGPGVLVAGDGAGAVHVWRADGTRVSHRALHRGPVSALALDPARRRVFSAGGDGVILGSRLDP